MSLTNKYNGIGIGIGMHEYFVFFYTELIDWDSIMHMHYVSNNHHLFQQGSQFNCNVFLN